jgi:hypothetical protein
MTRIRCRERRCTFNKSGVCTCDEIEYEPDAGCLTLELREDAGEDEEEEWEEEEDLDADLGEELEEEEDEADEDDAWDADRDGEDAYLGGHRRKR